jgi:hypothetical protein
MVPRWIAWRRNLALSRIHLAIKKWWPSLTINNDNDSSVNMQVVGMRKKSDVGGMVWHFGRRSREPVRYILTNFEIHLSVVIITTCHPGSRHRHFKSCFHPRHTPCPSNESEQKIGVCEVRMHHRICEDHHRWICIVSSALEQAIKRAFY